MAGERCYQIGFGLADAMDERSGIAVAPHAE